MITHAFKRSVYGGDPDQRGPSLFRDYRLFVSYEEWEDLPYILKYAGEDNLLTGSDWGHHGGRRRGGDPSGQPEIFSNMRAREDVPSSVVEKILVDNPHRFYGIAS